MFVCSEWHFRPTLDSIILIISVTSFYWLWQIWCCRHLLDSEFGSYTRPCIRVVTHWLLQIKIYLPSIFLPVVFPKALFSVLYFLSCILPHSALSSHHLLLTFTFMQMILDFFSRSILATLTQVSPTSRLLWNTSPPWCLQIFSLLTLPRLNFSSLVLNSNFLK